MTKQEKIQEAYGESFDLIKLYIDENGWCKDGGDLRVKKIFLGNGKNKSYSDINLFYLEFNKLVVYYNKTGNWRPKSLQGIEYNNGWIKIESEEDLPKFTIQYHVLKNGSLSKAYYVKNNRWIVDGNDYPKTSEIHGITHYQEIIIPKPPIY